MKIVGILCAAVCSAALAQAQTNYTAVSNLGRPSSNQDEVHYNSPAAISFTTGNTATYLFSVSVSMSLAPAGVYPPITVSLYSDAGGSPGSDLADLSGNSYPTNTAVYTYTNTSPVLLAANTTYWVVESISASNPNSFFWSLTTNNASDSGSVWTIGVMKQNLGSGWATQPFYPRFSVTVTPPTPALAIFQPIVLTYSNWAFPFVLQECSDLTKTNWVTATNAIQLATVSSNQIVFVVPPSGPQMFYRLTLP